MRVVLHTFKISPPGMGVELALQQKGIAYRVRAYHGGLHRIELALRRMPERTIPQLEVDGETRVGSMAIVRWLDELVPDPPLHPAERRAEVEEAERWGHDVVQEMPRRLYRFAALHHLSVRRWILRSHGLPTVGASLATPLVKDLAGRAQATEAHAREALRTLPEVLEHADALLADGLLGAPGAWNAAGLQVVPSVRSLGVMDELRDVVEASEVGRVAKAVLPDVPDGLPATYPADWLPRAAASPA